MDFTQKSETDIAYYVLSQAGEPKYYKDLVMEVIDKKHKPVQSLSRAISEVYTLINMDSRFHHQGQSMWGLTEWNPPETKRSHSTSGTTSRTSTRTTAKRREKLLEGIQEEDGAEEKEDKE